MAKKFKEGDIFVIPMKGGNYCFGKVLANTWGFFDFCSKEPIFDEEKLKSSSYAFQISVVDAPLKNGQWKIIANMDLTEEERVKKYFYKMDKLSHKVWKTLTGIEEIPTTIEECLSLELCAVYDPVHVLERLEYYFSGEDDPSILYDTKMLEEKGISTM
ncbi:MULTISPECIES: immunity 26/phosphotriesterase HocA family protein [Idiomarinaceae]|uniref:Immunity 26/phosphotriesterase HocA family protein n=1 Tax=Pseudidiomarina sp. PP-1MA TaxID=3237706 RepID=A0AB39X3C7_9GAMM|nr:MULTISPECIES: immunity 26/phosphotriesterase HocA family protein [Idiomarina]MRJ41505.1 hypothetical protein [Idiomarina sp. FeN1]NCU56980.1 hypothetical protein [Idiomarina sp. FenA--70]NCU59689.1 hypothetical protein [Idiomarina sp. FenBw--71]UUN14337.1 immunity 26/phosphotriesterase HocA family protein [Idiomarina loihiensis]